jgi:hypothetical protein
MNGAKANSRCVADLLLARSKIDTPLSLLLTCIDPICKKTLCISVSHVSACLRRLVA